MKNKIIYTLILLIIISFFFIGEKEVFEEEKKEREVVLKEISSFMGEEIGIFAMGKVESKGRRAIISQVPGIVERVPLSIGDNVSKGDVLVYLNSEESESRLSQAKSSLLMQEARLRELSSGSIEEQIRIRESALRSAEKTLEKTKDQLEDAIYNARKSLFNNDIRAYLKNPDKFPDDGVINSPIITGIYKGDEEGKYEISLYSSKSQSGYSFRYIAPDDSTGVGIVSSTIPQPLGEKGLFIQFPEDFRKRANLDWEIYIPNYRSPSYLQFYNAYNDILREKEPSIELAKESVKQREEELSILKQGAREEQIIFQEGQLSQAEEALKLARINYNRHIIRAPFEGVITSILVEEGRMISAGQESIEIYAEELFELEVYLSPESSKFISVGDKVRTKRGYSGSISGISKTINPLNGQIEVLVSLQEKSKLLPGEYIEIEILPSSYKDTLFLPLSLIEINSSGSFVFSVDNGKIKRIPVKIGRIEGDRVAITEGLEDILYIIEKDSSLKDGQEVIVK